MKKTPAPPTKSTFKRGKWLIAHCSLLLAISAPAWAQQDATPAVPSAVNIGAAVIPGIMDALLQQHKTPQQLWDDGRLIADLLPDVLNQQPLGRTENQQAAHQLCALLVKQLPEELDDPLALPPRTRLRLAQYFKSIKDARAVTFYEAILSLIKAPREAGVREVFELSDYYTETGDWEKAAETRLRMKDYTTAEPYLANANVEAARMYVQHGQEEKAQPLYERAQKSSYGWAAGMALYDQGIQLIGQGKYKEAIEVLSKPIKGQYADQVTTGLLSNLGYCYYRDGKVDLAKETSKKAIQQYEALQNPLQNEGLEAQINGAKETLRWIDQWAKQPIVIEPHQLKFMVDDASDAPYLIRTLQVLTERNTPIEIVPDNSSIKVEVLDISAPNDGSYIYYAQKEVRVKLDRGAINQSKEVSLKISSSGAPQDVVTVPVQIMVPDPIMLSSSSAFFGFVKAGEVADNDITLTANKPFHILKVEADAPEVLVKFDATQNSEKHVLQLQLMATESGRMYKGQVHVTTDLPEQRELDVAYYGYAQNQ